MKGRIAKRNVMIVYSNQLKDKIGVMFGKRTTTYGGNAIRYHAALRFECVMTGRIKGKGGDAEGITMKVDNQKNKCWLPYRKAEGIEFMFDGGFNYEQSLLMALESKGMVTKSGLKYKIHPLGNGFDMRKADFINKLRGDPVLAGRMREVLDASI